MQKQAIDSAIGLAEHEYHLEDVATKPDLKALEAGLKHDIELLRADTKRDIVETKADLIRWVVGVRLLHITIITALLLKIDNHFNA